jgi:hypothetical protein
MAILNRGKIRLGINLSLFEKSGIGIHVWALWRVDA